MLVSYEAAIEVEFGLACWFAIEEITFDANNGSIFILLSNGQDSGFIRLVGRFNFTLRRI